MPYVFSTCAAAVTFQEYGKAVPGSAPAPLRSVTIKGGANLADKNIYTPEGVVTQLSDSDYEFLTTHPQIKDSFKRFCDAGFMTVHKLRANPNRVARDMESRDGSAPLRPGDFAGALPDGVVDGGISTGNNTSKR